MIINVWLALRDDAQALIKIRLTWDEETQGEYTGPVTDRQFKLFRFMHDRANVQRLFRTDRVAGRDWTLWSLYFNFRASVLQKVKDELDALVLAFPNHVKITAAWHWDSRQVGTQWELDENGDHVFHIELDDEGEETVVWHTTGTPIYPLHSRILELMPDIVTYDIDGNETSRTRPTAASDVNKLQGQKDRRFVS